MGFRRDEQDEYRKCERQKDIIRLTLSSIVNYSAKKRSIVIVTTQLQTLTTAILLLREKERKETRSPGDIQRLKSKDSNASLQLKKGRIIGKKKKNRNLPSYCIFTNNRVSHYYTFAGSFMLSPSFRLLVEPQTRNEV